MTKKEFITLLREDVLYQQHELTPITKPIIKINGIVLQDFRTIKLQLWEHHVAICHKQNGICFPIVSVWYEDIHTIGYKYYDTSRLEHRLDELRGDNIN